MPRGVYNRTAWHNQRNSLSKFGISTGVGRKHSAEHSSKIAKAMLGNQHSLGITQSQSTLEKKSDSMKQTYQDNPDLIEKRRKQFAGNQFRSGKVLSAEHKAAITASNIRRLETRISFKPKGYYDSVKSCVRVPYRSNLEHLAMQELDRLDQVISWDYEKIRVPYKRNGRDTITIVDFLVVTNNSKILIEVKGSYWLQDYELDGRLAAVREFAAANRLEFILWTDLTPFRF